jgi:hypothetical protein
VRELSLHVLDILQNAREAKATLVELTVDEDLAGDRLTIEVRDNGVGMTAETLQRVRDPFFTTRKTRHVGLGLPLFSAAAERCNGSLTLESAPGRGTRVAATFQLRHLDRAPMGDLTGTVLSVLLGEPYCDLVYVHRKGGKEFSLDTREVRRELGPVELSHPAVREWLSGYLTEAEEDLEASAAERLGSPTRGEEV